MSPSFRPVGPVLMLLAALALAACDSAEERAEKHYQRGVALLAEGDADRALVEFRNVFRLDGSHVPARLAFAAVQRERGLTREALGQYLRVAEQDPANLEAQRGAIELALELEDFATAEEHAADAFAAAPADPEIRGLKATVDFRHPATREAAVEMARAVAAEAPEVVAAQIVLIADRLNAGAPAEALPLVEAALARTPDDRGLHLVRLATLEALGDAAAVGDALRQMAARFPDEAAVQRGLVQWHLRQGDEAGAEAVLRAAAERSPAAEPQPALTLAQFLLEVKGPEAARAELEARIAAAAAAGGDPRPFQRALAGLDFSQGRTTAAVAALEGLLAGAEPSDATRDLQVALAGMHAAAGDAAASAALVDTVLAGDPNNVDALKLRARAAIEADRPDAAIQDMRTASREAPEDPEVMTIMALAHEREGSRELAGERLARAVEVSDRGPGESLRYARFLMQDDRTGPAEGVVVDALRKAPENRDLLAMLGRIHLARHDWARADQVAAILRGQESPEARAMAAGLETASLRGQGKTSDAIAALEGIAGADGADARAMAELLQGYAEAGDLEAAERYLDEALARDPASLPARLMRADLDQLKGDPAAAEAGYRAVIAAEPALPQGYQALYAFLVGQGRSDEAVSTLDAGLAAAPDSPALLFARAAVFEAQGDPEGAIAAYERLYAQDSGSPVLANNLASLLAGSRADPESLERAFAIARRLRGTEVPEFQDTYGWILHRRGDNDQALGYLVPAAAALPGNAQVQFHLAETQFALGRPDEARASFERALAAAEAGSPLPEAEAARARIAEIDARGREG